MKPVIIISVVFVLLIPIDAFSISVSEIEKKLLEAQSEEDVENVILEVVTSSEYQKACQLLLDKISSMSPPKTEADVEKALPTLQDYETLKCAYTKNIWGSEIPEQYSLTKCKELISQFDEPNQMYYDALRENVLIDHYGKTTERSDRITPRDMMDNIENEFQKYCVPIAECPELEKQVKVLYVEYKKLQLGSLEEKLSAQDFGLINSPFEMKCNFSNSITRYYDTQEQYFDKPIPTAISSSEIVCGNGTVENAYGQCVPDYPDTEPSSKGGGCLIATATYGSELAPQVQQLRELRDNKLLQTEVGTSFMESFNDFYYSFSPIIADLERENPVFKEMVKIAITPMITSLSILNYVDMDSEVEVLGYGISLILLNVGMYFGIPAIVILKIKKKF